LLLVSCGNHTFNEPNSTLLAKVTFCNDSSYGVIIHQDNFDGAVLAELFPAQCLSLNVSPSDNYGIGSVFSVEYSRFIEDDLSVIVKDPDRQITQNIEAGKSYTISIPQPKNLDSQESFIKIQNASSMDFELNCLNNALLPINGELPVPSSKYGLYIGSKVKNTACFINGEVSGLIVRQGLIDAEFHIPEFTMENGYIYNFKFDGHEVIQKEPERIMQQ